MANPPALTGPPEPVLTPQKRLILEFYLGRCRGDAVEAVRLAGVSEDDRVLRATATRFLNDPAVRYHIEKWTSRHMAPMEILALLASHARGDMGDFWEVPDDPAEPPRLSLRKARELGLTHLIKKLKVGPNGTEVELYDAQAALKDLAKIEGLYRRDDSSTTIVVQHVLRNMPAELRERVLASVSARAGHALASGNEEEAIDVEVTESANSETALVPWQPEDTVHGFGDEESEDADV